MGVLSEIDKHMIFPGFFWDTHQVNSSECTRISEPMSSWTQQVLYANVDLSRFGLEVISLLDHQLTIEALPDFWGSKGSGFPAGYVG